MASVTKRKGRDGTPAKKWTALYTDERGKTRQRAAFTDKGESLRFARRLEDEARKRRRGLIDDREVRLADHGITPIIEHVETYEKHLESKGGDERHRKQTIRDINVVIEACGWSTLRDLDGSSLVSHLHEYRETGISARSVNARRQSVRGFSRWCVASGRLASDPLAGVPRTSEHKPTYERRALSDEEIAKLLKATEAGPERLGLSGASRAMLYRVAMGTGFRAGEMDSLTPASFDLDGKPPTITVEAGYSKRRKRDVQPIQQSLAGALKRFLRDMDSGVKLWPIKGRKTAQMLREDLEAACLSATDSAGRVADFHSLRHTFITRLNRAGVPVKVAQQLARHSTITLTMDKYTHIGISDEVLSLESLPDLDGAEDDREAQQATGTHDVSGSDVATYVQHSGRNPSQSGAESRTGERV